MAAGRIAALDVGSNTVHLLVGEVVDGRVHEVRRDVVMPRIGAEVNRHGVIGAAKIAEVAAEVGRMSGTARDAGADVLLCCATEAVRRAGDRDVALQAFRAAAGVPVVLLPGEVEARLSFRGAVSGTGLPGVALVADVGGGSTELILGEFARIDALVSLPIGSGAVTDRWLHDDPPTRSQLAAGAAGVRDALAQAPPGAPSHVITTGGTAAALPRLLGLPVESHLTASDLARCRTVATAQPSATLAAAHDLARARARVLAGGVEIIDAIRTHYHAGAVHTTIHGLRSGMILAYVAGGDRWVEG